MLPLTPSDDSVDGRSDTYKPTWTRNRRLVYATNFAHMTMYTMCLGGVFDIFLYNLSMDVHSWPYFQTIGQNASAYEPPRFGTFAQFDLEFHLKPLLNEPPLPTDPCNKDNTCCRSIMHVISSTASNTCCDVGDRIPGIFFDNGTYLSVSMDSLGQNTSMTVAEYNRKQACTSPVELEPFVWHYVKLKVSGMDTSKGMFNSSDGGLLLFVNYTQVCEVPGTAYHTLPVFSNAYGFLGAVGAPFVPTHKPANAQIKDILYRRPASNLFVGLINSLQGVLAVMMMYPLGWIGDHMSRYTLLRSNILVGCVAGAFLAMSVLSNSKGLLYTGIVFFTFYQQCISALIYAALADNTMKNARTSAGANYKTISALAMSLGPALQMVVLAGDNTDQWSPSTLRVMLLPGWVFLPVIGMCVFALEPVGKKWARLPNTDEVTTQVQTQTRVHSLNNAWLDQVVFCGMRRRFVVASTVNAFFIGTLLANGMTSRYYSLYFTQVLKFSPLELCALNAVCRLWIAVFTQLVKPLSRVAGRMNLAVVLHLAATLFTLGVYGGGIFEPSIGLACGSYMMRFATLQSRDPLLYAMTMDTVPPEQRSRWAALNSLRTLSFSASAVIGGHLADLYGYEFSFTVTVFTLLVTTLLIVPGWLVFPRSEGANFVAAPSTDNLPESENVDGTKVCSST